jgi:hypothetical protein
MNKSEPFNYIKYKNSFFLKKVIGIEFREQIHDTHNIKHCISRIHTLEISKKKNLTVKMAKNLSYNFIEKESEMAKKFMTRNLTFLVIRQMPI